MLASKAKKRLEARKARHRRVRKKISGTPTCPRLVVFRSLKHIYAQIIDDDAAKTLVSASTIDKECNTAEDNKMSKVDAAKAVGELIAQRALEAGITQVRFDRGGNIYHGRVKALSLGARESGLLF